MDRIGYATRAELLEKAKKLNIVGRWDMTKGELMAAITEAQKQQSTVEDVENPEDYKDSMALQKTTKDYATNVEIGTVIAFNVMLGGKQRVLSAKVKGKEKAPGSHLLVETKNGSKYRVGLDDVVWVKTGLRWPRWVLELLKGEGTHVD